MGMDRKNLGRGVAMCTIVVVDYDPLWPGVFATLCANVWDVLGHFAVAIEHMGSTAVSGLAAKPFIDLSRCGK